VGKGMGIKEGLSKVLHYFLDRITGLTGLILEIR
jgi:hypothetical protein